jgi:hypothetical protein
MLDTNALAYLTSSSVTKRKSLINIDTLGQFHKLFQRNLRHYWRIALSFDSGYVANGVNYAKKFY